MLWAHSSIKMNLLLHTLNFQYETIFLNTENMYIQAARSGSTGRTKGPGKVSSDMWRFACWSSLRAILFLFFRLDWTNVHARRVLELFYCHTKSSLSRLTNLELSLQTQNIAWRVSLERPSLQKFRQSKTRNRKHLRCWLVCQKGFELLLAGQKWLPGPQVESLLFSQLLYIMNLSWLEAHMFILRVQYKY